MHKDIREFFRNKKVLVFGLGIQGGGLGDLLAIHSMGAHIRVTDLKTESQLKTSLSKLPPGIQTTLSRHDMKDIEWADIILKNPAVPNNNEFINRARDLNKMVLGSSALFLKYTKLKTIGITGTRGKSTTTNLIYQILNKAFPDQVVIGGNIPQTSLLQLLLNQDGKRYAVLELSSFQLASSHDLKVSPNISVVTNIYPDHLNYYPSMQEYIHDKLAILQYQTDRDFAVLNKNNKYTASMQSETKATVVFFEYSDMQTHLIGKHNLANIDASVKVANILNIDNSITESVISSFEGIPFRLQKIREKDGVTFINDTTSTTPIATITAIDAIQENMIIIVGGAHKNLPIHDMVDKICSSSNVKGVVILGSRDNDQFTSSINKCSQKILGQVFSMEEAVDLAYKNATPGSVVLLSPGFASFDLFKNEFDRGEQFNEAVKNL